MAGKAGTGTGEGGNPPEGDSPVSRAELDKVHEKIDRLIEVFDGQGSKPKGRGGEPTRGQQEGEARESVEEAFARLDREKEHAAHHEDLRKRQAEADQRASERAKRTAPVEQTKVGRGLWEY